MTNSNVFVNNANTHTFGSGGLDNEATSPPCSKSTANRNGRNLVEFCRGETRVG